MRTFDFSKIWFLRGFQKAFRQAGILVAARSVSEALKALRIHCYAENTRFYTHPQLVMDKRSSAERWLQGAVDAKRHQAGRSALQAINLTGRYHHRRSARLHQFPQPLLFLLGLSLP